jgi:ABC-type Fe3+ transport system permease subunit
MKFMGALLVIAGIVALGFGVLHGGMSWSRQDRVIDSGSNQGALVKTHSLPLAPIAGGFCIVAGVVVLIASARQHA